MFLKLMKFFELKFFYFCISKFNFFYKKKKIKNTDFSEIKKKLQNKNIALVGNSHRLLRKINRIDTYDVVIRINIVPPKKIHRQVGKRIDFLFLQGSGGTHWLLEKDIPKVWLENVSSQTSNYAKGKIFHYPELWEKDLSRTLKNNCPTAGAKSIHFLLKILKNPKITLFGFDHKPGNWYIYNFNRLHDYKKEAKFFKSLVKKYKNIKYAL